MPKIVDPVEKRQQILAAAATVFSHHGYRGTNLQRVATQAGMGKSSIYHYFSTKDALFAALVQELLQREATVFDSLVTASGSPPERLRALLNAILALFDEWAKVGPLLIDCLREEQGRRAVRHTLSQARTALTRLIREGQRTGVFRAGNPSVLATVVVGCLDGLLLQELLEPGITRSASVGTALREMLNAALSQQRAT